MTEHLVYIHLYIRIISHVYIQYTVYIYIYTGIYIQIAKEDNLITQPNKRLVSHNISSTSSSM